MIDLTKGVQRPYHHIQLTKEAKSDMATWPTIFGQVQWQNVCFLDDEWKPSSSIELRIDAAGSTGCGAIFGQHWFCDAWPASWTSLDIIFLELFLIVLSWHIWGPLIANK